MTPVLQDNSMGLMLLVSCFSTSHFYSTSLDNIRTTFYVIGCHIENQFTRIFSQAFINCLFDLFSIILIFFKLTTTIPLFSGTSNGLLQLFEAPVANNCLSQCNRYTPFRLREFIQRSAMPLFSVETKIITGCLSCTKPAWSTLFILIPLSKMTNLLLLTDIHGPCPFHQCA